MGNLKTSFTAAVSMIALVASVGAAAAQDGAKESVGVSVAVAVNVTELESDLLTDDLGKALSARFDVTVVSGEAARAKLPPDGLPETCLAETECLGQTAAALGVDKLLLLVAVRVGSDIQVDATLYDAKTKKSETRPTVKMTDKRSGWPEAFSNAADSLLPGAKVREGGTGNGGTGNGNGNGGNGNGGTGNGIGPEIPPAEKSYTGPIVLGGAAAAVAAGALVMGAIAQSKCKDVPNPEPPPDMVEDCSDSKDLQLGTDIVGGVSAVMGVTAVIWAITVAQRPDPQERSIGLRTGPGDIGLAIGGRF